jgi:hypothetical protein
VRQELAAVIETSDLLQLSELVVEAGKLVQQWAGKLDPDPMGCPCTSVCGCEVQCRNECSGQCTCMTECTCMSQCPCQKVGDGGYQDDDWSRVLLVAQAIVNAATAALAAE